MNIQKTPLLVYLIIILLPYLLFHSIMPFVSHVTIGNDYILMLKMQMELLFSIKAGSYPLYMPGVGYGHSSAALTLGQVFHPISHLASILPGYWAGNVNELNNFLKLLFLGFSQLALFAFLRKMRLSLLFSFLLSLVTVYNLRVPDLFRYGAALEAYTAHLLLCAAIGWYFINPTKLLGPLCITGATYLLVCSGHPQMMYFGLLGAGLFILIVPFFLSDMLYDEQVDYKTVFRFWLKVGCCLFLGIMLSSVYILPFYFDFFSVNISRVGQGYSWANENLDMFIGTLNNFFLPFRSTTHGAFGGSSLILMAVIVPVLSCFKIKLPRSVWYIWGLLFFLFLYMQGSRTPIHRFVWEYFPLASSFRTSGRISMIMPVFMMMILVWVVKEEPYQLRLKGKAFTVRPLAILALIASLLIVIYYVLYIGGYYVFSSPMLQELLQDHRSGYGMLYNIPFVWVELIVIVLGITSLITLAYYSMHKGEAGAVGIFLIIVMIVQMGIVLKFRSVFWIEKKYNSPTFEEIIKQKKIKLDYLYYPGGGMHSSIVISQLEHSFVEPFLGKIFTEVIPVESRKDAYERMEKERFPQQAFVEGYDNGKAKSITEGAKDMKSGRVKLTYSSFNRLEFRVDSEANALFGLSYPYTGHWSAWVNGEKMSVYRVNGEAHAVEIPEGESLLEFRYWSDAFYWGMVISCTALGIIGLFVCFRGFKGMPRIIGIAIVFIVSAGGFMLWCNSLYTGDNLETEYIWTYTPPLKTPNLAYGKKNRLDSSATSAHLEYDFARWHMMQKDLYVGRFIDGDKDPGSGFSTRLSDNPGWLLDLNFKERIETILLFESSRDLSVNTRPLTVALSHDGVNWRSVASVVSLMNKQGPLKIVFKKAQTARYIKIKASGKSKLSFDEVEVYGPKDIE